MIQNGEYKSFFLYTVFFKKNCAVWPNLPILCINFEKLVVWCLRRTGNVSAVYFSSGVYWSVWWFLNSFSNYSRRFYFTYIFHDVSWFAVGFKWNYQSGMFYCEHYFVCLFTLFVLFFFCLNVLMEKESFPLCLFSDDSPLGHTFL